MPSSDGCKSQRRKPVISQVFGPHAPGLILLLTTMALFLGACGGAGECAIDADCPDDRRCVTSGGLFFDRPVCIGEGGGSDATGPDVADTSTECTVSNEGVEICDGIDNDCDGRTDEGPLVLTSIAAGHGYACGTTSGGDAYCWGTNTNGELGVGFVSERQDAPVSVASQASFEAIAGNPNFGKQTCGLTFDGQIYCWGQSVDQLGAQTTGSSDTSTPIRIPTSVGNEQVAFSQVDLGGLTLCGISTDRRAYCWGRNGSGQLGDGSSEPRTEPGAVQLTGTAKYISVGIKHACATMDSGKAFCWGDNTFGQLGNDRTEDLDEPVEITTPVEDQSWTKLVAGDEHSCGLKSDGTLYCWGSNTSGQLGLGSSFSSESKILTPTRVDASGSMYTDVSAGTYHSCAIDAEGGLECWGDVNSDEVELGVGQPGTNQPLDVTLGEATAPIGAVQTGVLGTCLADADQRVFCWGDPSGDPQNALAETPVGVGCPVEP